MRIDETAKTTSLQNWPMQSNGADIMRYAACLMTQAGIKVCCPVHDAFLIEGPLENEAEIVREAQRLMAKASAFILDGFELRSEAQIIRPGQRLHDERGELFFEMIIELLDD